MILSIYMAMVVIVTARFNNNLAKQSEDVIERDGDWEQKEAELLTIAYEGTVFNNTVTIVTIIVLCILIIKGLE